MGIQKEVSLEEARVETELSGQPSKTRTTKLEAKQLRANFGATQVLKGVDLKIPERRITAIMGPSGCGKTTFIRCLNRLHELTPGARAEGEVMLDGMDIYSPGVDPVAIRRKIGMVFQKPNPFPTMSVYENVAAGLKLNGVRDRKLLDEVVERSLRLAFLWDEIKDDLKKSGAALSGGQQQRLCIAHRLRNH